MNTNTIVLGKYAMNEALAAVVARAALFSDDKTVIIVKAEDDAPYSPYVVRHARHMMGDVCDVLWEAAKLSPDMPLLLASSRGYRYDFTLPAMPDGADLAIFGDEAALSGFKFDLTGPLDRIRSASGQRFVPTVLQDHEGLFGSYRTRHFGREDSRRSLRTAYGD